MGSAGTNRLYVESAVNNGAYVNSATGSGVHVNSVGGDSVFICHTGAATTCVPSYLNNGIEIGNAESVDIYVTTADVGLDVLGRTLAGYFHGNIVVDGYCIGCLQVNFAINSGKRALLAGDVVSVGGVTPTDFDNGPALWQVVPVEPGQVVVGVVAGSAERVTTEEQRPGETGKRLVSREGTAQPGEYVTIVYGGPMQVKVSSGESHFVAGTRSTAAADG